MPELHLKATLMNINIKALELQKKMIMIMIMIMIIIIIIIIIIINSDLPTSKTCKSGDLAKKPRKTWRLGPQTWRFPKYV